MEIKFSDYIKNPTGGRSHMVGQMDAAKAVYNDKFNKMMVKSAGLIRYQLFKNGEDRYAIKISLPSESIDRLLYDVIIDFTTKDDVRKRSNKLTDYYVRFFSNDPNFTFTYAHVFNKNKLIVPELISKVSPEALKENPKVTNPINSVGYVKSIYFAYLFITMRGLDNKLAWTGAPKITASALTSNVMTSNRKLIQVRELQKIQKIVKTGNMIGDVGDLKNLHNQANRVTSMTKAVKASQKVSRQNMLRSGVKIVPRVRTVGRHR